MPTASKPDFFIVGAPKCGTTALYAYLGGHPDIGMSKRKEPHFFAPDILGDQRHSRTLAQYLSNFDRATGKRRIGEASTGYLVSRRAPQEILDFNPSAQIIVMLRNPIDVIHSLHSMRLCCGAEHITRFELAVDSQEERYWQLGPFRGEPVPRLSYREITRFSEQIQRYFDAFGRERVHVILFDDFASAPGIAYEKVLSFLGLRSDGRRNFEIINGNRRMRSRAVQQQLQRLKQSKALGRFERAFPVLWQEARAIVARLNFVYERRPAIEAGFRQRLEMEYAPEVRNLERLLGRTLDHQSPPAQTVEALEGDARRFGWKNIQGTR
ncbi:MAG TPA: sulfotransferase [Terriglobales bacterium]|nr:sulfotransferase [Terriglobales bacterium]